MHRMTAGDGEPDCKGQVAVLYPTLSPSFCNSAIMAPTTSSCPVMSTAPLPGFSIISAIWASSRRLICQRLVHSLYYLAQETLTDLSWEQSTPILVPALNLTSPALPTMIPPAQWLIVIAPPNRSRPNSGTSVASRRNTFEVSVLVK